MLKVLLLFVLLIAGIVVGPMIAGHQGYVLIQTDNYNIETSVTGLAIILILAMVVLFAIEWLLRRIFRTGAHTRGWFVGRKRRRARKQTEQALLKLAEGDYQQVEKLMAKNADHAEQPVVNYLLAAEAAQQRGDEARANQHLERAAELAGNDTIPVEITRACLQLARNETMQHVTALISCWKLRHAIRSITSGGTGVYPHRGMEFAAGYHPINGESPCW